MWCTKEPQANVQAAQRICVAASPNTTIESHVKSSLFVGDQFSENSLTNLIHELIFPQSQQIRPREQKKNSSVHLKTYFIGN